MVLILCKTALISGTLICSRPINHLSIFQYFNISIFQSFNKFSLLYFQLNNPPFKETVKSHPSLMKCQSEFDTLTLTPHLIFPYQYHDFNKSTCPYAPPGEIKPNGIIGTGSSTQKSEPIYLSPMIASVVYMKKITRKSVKHLVCR